MKKTLFYAISLIIMSIMAACNSDSEPSNPIPTDTCFDFATLASTSEGGSTFTLRKSADSPLITYTSTYSFTTHKDIKVGQRLIIMYVPMGGTPYVNGQITLYGFRTLDNTDQNLVFTNAKNTSNWASYPVNPTIFDRTGDYINLQAQVACQSTAKPKKLILAVDETTTNSEYPQLYIIYTPATEGSNAATAYASWDISDLWSLPTCKGIDINYQGTSAVGSKRFAKSEGFTPHPGDL